MSYYNTNNESGAELKKSWKTTEAQEDIILAYFKINPDKLFSPDDIYSLFDPTKVPITSIRRSITNLTTDGYLEKTGVQKIGRYGKFCYCWKLKL